MRLLAIKLVFLLLIGFEANAQKKYWIYQSDLPSDFTLTLLPEPENCSEWLEACTYFLTEREENTLDTHGIPYTPVICYRPLHTAAEAPTLGFALEQIGARHFIEKGLDGSGVKIGIIDGGFLDANNDPTLAHFFSENLIKGYRDYITPEMESYGGKKSFDDAHGTEVWQLIGGYDAVKDIQFGLARKASYYLARTDHGGYERRVEEDYLISALEWMYANGVKLVNVSLGYSTGFDNPAENYMVSQMDGKTSASARAIEIAAAEKGMLIVVAAGNEAGRSTWQVLSTPGDAQHALTVGASKFDVWDKMNYSSIGPETLEYVKPDISVYATQGTSFAAPVVTGIAACVWQHSPHLTNLEVMEVLKKAGHFYPYPNNYLGYGVPTCSRILDILEQKEVAQVKTIRINKDRYVLRGKFDKFIVVYHKKDERNVLARMVYRPLGRKIKIKRMNDASQSSVLLGKEVIEVFWE